MFWGEFRIYHVPSEVSSLEPDLVSYFEGGRFSFNSVGEPTRGLPVLRLVL